MKKKIIYGLLVVFLGVGGFFAIKMRPPTHDEKAQEKVLKLIQSNQTFKFEDVVEGKWDTINIFDKMHVEYSTQYNSFEPELNGKTQYITFANEERVISYIEIPISMSHFNVDTFNEMDAGTVIFFGDKGKLQFKYDQKFLDTLEKSTDEIE